jgi:hypothetical protein
MGLRTGNVTTVLMKRIIENMEYLPSVVDLFLSVIELRPSYYQFAGSIPVPRKVHQVSRLAQSSSAKGRQQLKRTKFSPVPFACT